MKDKHDHHDNREHREPPHEEHERKPKRRRRRHGGLILILLLIIIILILILVLFNPFGWGGGSGFLGNSGSNSGDNSSTVSVESDTSSEVSDTIVIKIDENTILIDGEECADENALKEKITDIGTTKKYELDHSTAIKETYDKVKNVLTELHDALNIEVDYNE